MTENTDAYLRNHAYCMAMSMRAYGLIAGMQAENQQRVIEGKSLAYTEEAFDKVLDDCQQGHNSVITNMSNGIY